MSNEPILVTGAAGFIGYHVSERLLSQGRAVIGIDNINDYYDPALKYARLKLLRKQRGFDFARLDISDQKAVERLFGKFQPKTVIHLAAQAGVRYSLLNPHVYASANIVGFLNILESCRRADVTHLVYASSSSVYGANVKTPFAVGDNVDYPVSLYAATKRSNELMAHVYAHLYGIPMTGLRFFTVYGPWGRPDMAYYSFTKKILSGDAIEVFNYGNLQRDFTFIDDIVEGVTRIVNVKSELSGPAQARGPHTVYNIGNSQPVQLLEFINTLGKIIGIEPKLKLRPMQAGDVLATFADTGPLELAVGFRPNTQLDFGLEVFYRWYKEYHKAW